MLKVFGCSTYYHATEGNLEPRAKNGFFMGYRDGINGYRVQSLFERKVILSRDVIFEELFMMHSKSDEDLGKVEDVTKQWCFRASQLETLVIRNSLKHLMRLIRIFKCTLNIRIQHQLRELTRRVKTIQNNPKPQHPESDIGKSKLLKDMALIQYLMRYRQIEEHIDSFEPTTYQEVISYFEVEEWAVTINEDMDSLQKNQTWDFVELPEGKKEVGCKWIFKKKSLLSTKEVVFYKARLIAKCYNQKEGMDYNEIFSLQKQSFMVNQR